MNYALHRCLRLQVLSAWIASLMVVQTAIAEQSAAGLVIQVLEASAGQNVTSQELPPIKVRVMDRTGLAISGANVMFAAPEGDSFGHFLPNATQISVTTDTQGIATAPRFRTNSTLGDYGIQVVASYRDSVSRIEIPHSNVLKKKSSNKKLFILSAVVGGAAAAAFASKGNSSGPAAAAGALVTPTLTLGQSSVNISPGVPPPSVAAPATGTASSSPSVSSGISSGGNVVQPITQTQPTSSSKCGKSKKGDCR